MDKKAMEKSKLKLLLNAEPFGFGPTAAIASFFPYLRDKFGYVGYLGKNHTLDLQNGLPYDSIHDTSKLHEDDIKQIVSQYDIFLTALDFETASLAKSLGLKVIIYDPLTWYWKIVPDIVRQCDLYFSQDFFGVKERIKNERYLFPRATQVIPPIVSRKRLRTSKKYVLINLGGLQNPLWSVDDVSLYAKTFIEAIKGCLPIGEKVIIATSKAITERLNDKDAKSYTRAEMHDILENTKYAFMTPGLGNIYDVAKFDIPTVWLPPANDSQGQQLDLLRKHEMSDAQIDWTDLGRTMDYFAEQSEVLRKIKEAIYSNLGSSELKSNIMRTYKQISKKESSSTGALLDEFGTGGALCIGDAVYEFSQSLI